MNLTAIYGHLDCLKYLHEIVGVNCSEWKIYWTGTFTEECIKYLNEIVGL